ncbi:hypothetical protein [Paraburkholderia sp. MM5477-R1]|uniref:hypothetical protein n=1 Tax=Paraburkholderia sp. MM5477-R1 TaxID=2991062 RepID=UPI003D197119
MNPATLTDAVYHANANHGNGNAAMVTLASTYSLSKQTLLCSEVGYLRNNAISNRGLNGGQYGASTIDDPASGGTSSSDPRCGHSQFTTFAGKAVSHVLTYQPALPGSVRYSWPPIAPGTTHRRK